MKLKTDVKSIYPVGRKLKWGVAGCGKFAETIFIPTLQLIKKSLLTSVYSSDIARAKEISNKFNTSKYFDDYQKFLEQDYAVRLM